MLAASGSRFSAQIFLAVKYPMAEPMRTSEAQCLSSWIRDKEVSAARL